MTNLQHIGNVKLSKAGKGINIHVFNGEIFGTIPLEKMEQLVDEGKITGKSSMIIPIMHMEND
jgi:hypothetical protein